MSMVNTSPMHVVEVGADNTIVLSPDIAHVFKPTDRFLVTIHGDTVILKRISPVNVLDIVAAMPDDEPPPTMDEINEIVHEVRRLYSNGKYKNYR